MSKLKKVLNLHLKNYLQQITDNHYVILRISMKVEIQNNQTFTRYFGN